MEKVERWLPVVGVPGYEVSDLGRVRRVGGLVRKAQVGNRYGHLKVTFWVERRRIGRWVHRMVLEAFVGPVPAGLIACHGNGISSDNRLSNLRWDTPASNNADMVRHGTSTRGSRNARAVLTEDRVRFLRSLQTQGLTGITGVAAEQGVKLTTLQAIWERRTWAWLQ